VETKNLPALQKAHDVPENPLMFWNFPAKQLVHTRLTMSDGVVPFIPFEHVVHRVHPTDGVLL
jgi:hypothetical protein